MIEIALMDTEKAGWKFCPFVFCDHCHLKIEDAKMAIATWNDEGRVRHFHKGDCSRAEPRDPYWSQLNEHLSHTASNAGVKELEFGFDIYDV